MTGKLDDKRTRYEFKCHVKDIIKDTKGRIAALVIYNDKDEAYFENLTIFLDYPIDKTIRL